ncbi:hypothetical protein EYF80_046481 [Liparis tanakae]|uniref:Uncharacterized protein n=1 Tax=Liparis tanakae TaxID=230148 RepID=A0A4Z2FQX0_9TELE|nr:hypothetical protein EYF80_046481 [Liparis tanakae]
MNIAGARAIGGVRLNQRENRCDTLTLAKALIGGSKFGELRNLPGEGSANECGEIGSEIFEEEEEEIGHSEIRKPPTDAEGKPKAELLTSGEGHAIEVGFSYWRSQIGNRLKDTGNT